MILNIKYDFLKFLDLISMIYGQTSNEKKNFM